MTRSSSPADEQEPFQMLEKFEANPFWKSTEDRHEPVRFEEGKRVGDAGVRLLLLVGIGYCSESGARTQKDIFAALQHDQISYFWGPAGEEEPAQYAHINAWNRGLWLAQVQNPIKSVEESRAARILNIFNGIETVEQVLSTWYDAAHMSSPRRRGVVKRKLPDVEKDEIRYEEEESGGDDETYCDSDPRSSTSPFRKRPRSQQRTHSSRTDHSRTPSIHEVTPRFYDCRFASSGTCHKMLLVGVGTMPKDPTEEKLPILANVSGNGVYYCCWSPLTGARRTRYECVRTWLVSFRDNDVGSTGFDLRLARAIRVQNLFNGIETLDKVLKSRADTDFVLAKRSIKHADTEASSADEQENDIRQSITVKTRRRARRRLEPGQSSRRGLPSESIATSTASQPDVIVLSDSPTPCKKIKVEPGELHGAIRGRSVTTSPATNDSILAPPTIAHPPTSFARSISSSVSSTLPSTPAHPTIAFGEALNVYIEALNGMCKPQKLQEAIAVLTGHTPPLHIIQKAIIACLNNKIEKFTQFGPYVEWKEETGAELRMEEDRGA